MFSEEPELEFCMFCGKEYDIFEFTSVGLSCRFCSLQALKDYETNNPDKVKQKVHRNLGFRRAKKYDVDSEEIVREAVFERDGGTCWLCGGAVDPTDWHLEHKIPLSRGGPHTYENVAVSHPDCNLAKGSRLVAC